MELNLLPENDLFLSQVAEEWDFDADGSPEELVRDMSKFMVNNGGVGLAAPQLGIAKRLFIMGNFMKLSVCINPKIISVADTRVSDLEGCLSFPDLFMKVKRPESCEVEYQNVAGEVIQRELTGMEARVFLHEFDHLIGLTFDQRVGSLTLKLAKERRRKGK